MVYVHLIYKICTQKTHIFQRVTQTLAMLSTNFIFFSIDLDLCCMLYVDKTVFCDSIVNSILCFERKHFCMQLTQLGQHRLYSRLTLMRFMSVTCNIASDIYKSYFKIFLHLRHLSDCRFTAC